MPTFRNTLPLPSSLVGRYEDGADRVFRNDDTQNWDAGELPRRKHTTFRTRRRFEINDFKSAKFSWVHQILLTLYMIRITVFKSLCKYSAVLTLRDRCPCFQSAESVRTLGGTSLFFTPNLERLLTKPIVKTTVIRKPVISAVAYLIAVSLSDIFGHNVRVTPQITTLSLQPHCNLVPCYNQHCHTACRRSAVPRAWPCRDWPGHVIPLLRHTLSLFHHFPCNHFHCFSRLALFTA